MSMLVVVVTSSAVLRAADSRQYPSGRDTIRSFSSLASARSWATTVSESDLLNVATTADGLSLISKVTLHETSDHGSGLCCRGGVLFLAWAGTDSHLSVIQSADAGLRFGSKTPLGDTSNNPPTLACDATNIFLGSTGTDGRLNTAGSADGLIWNAPASLHPINESSPTGPWLSILSGTAFLAWTGADNHLNVKSSTAWPSFGGKVSLPETGDHSPALPTGRDSNNSLNFQISESGAMTSDYKATYRDSSNNGLGLALFRQRVYLAWTGTNSHVNVAVLSPGELHVFGLMQYVRKEESHETSV